MKTQATVRVALLAAALTFSPPVAAQSATGKCGVDRQNRVVDPVWMIPIDRAWVEEREAILVGREDAAIRAARDGATGDEALLQLRAQNALRFQTGAAAAREDEGK